MTEAGWMDGSNTLRPVFMSLLKQSHWTFVYNLVLNLRLHELWPKMCFVRPQSP